MTVAPDQLIGPDLASAGLEGRLVPFRPHVQRHILAMVRDRAEAEELTQDTYARALARISQLRDPRNRKAVTCRPRVRVRYGLASARCSLLRGLAYAHA